MRLERRHWWPIVKAILAVAIVGAVGWSFARQLRNPELWERPLSPVPHWLVVSALLYLLGLGFSCAFWFRLMRAAGQHPPIPATVRAYYVALLGKYVPGKAWALVVRMMMIADAGVRPGIAALTAGYETLTLMASGALVAIVLMTLTALDTGFIWKAAFLLLVAGIPIIPGVFNRIVALLTRLASKSARAHEEKEANEPPFQLRATTLLTGLVQTACGWSLMGLSLAAMIDALVPDAPPLGLETWARYTGMMSLAYVAGFLALPAPGGLGVREFILEQLLQPELGNGAVVVVLVLRVVWTFAEVIMAGSVYWLPKTQDTDPDRLGSDQSK